MWIHGGALIGGGRAGIDADLLRRLLAEDLIVVSIDYRPAPEAKLPEIIKDVRDAYRWVRRTGPGPACAHERIIAFVSRHLRHKVE